MKLRGFFGSLTVPRPQEVQSSGQLLSGDRRDEDMGDRSKASAHRQRVTATLTRRVLLICGLVCRGSAKPHNEGIRRNKAAMGRWPVLYLPAPSARPHLNSVQRCGRAFVSGRVG